jgi:hypothetical protein
MARVRHGWAQGRGVHGQLDDGIGQAERVFAERADPYVAPEAQDPADDARRMVMVDVQRPTWWWGPAAEAQPPRGSASIPRIGHG